MKGTMQITQAFLPYLTPDRRVVGILAIPVTTFSGTETTMLVAGVDTPIALITPGRPNPVNNQQPSYMAATITASQDRNNFQSPVWLASFIPYGKWNIQLGVSFMVERETTLLQMLRGVNLSGMSSAVPPVVTIQSGVVNVDWEVNVNLTGNNPFIEVNWVVLLTEKAPKVIPESIAIDTVVVDPSGGLVKAFVVQAGSPVVNDVPLMNTLRFAKLTDSPVPKGSYIWSAVITNTDGSTSTAKFTVNNV